VQSDGTTISQIVDVIYRITPGPSLNVAIADVYFTSNANHSLGPLPPGASTVYETGALQNISSAFLPALPPDLLIYTVSPRSIPEPATLALIGSGLLLLGALRRHRFSG
jgi:hypothetical protein